MSLSDIGLFVSLVFPTILSIYKETRFVKKENFLVYGVSLIIFFFSFTAYSLPEDFSYLRWLNFIFLIFGIVMVFIFFNCKGYDKIKKFSLIFSWKNFGAFEFAFIAPIFLSKVPSFWNPTPYSILNLGLSLGVIFCIASGIFFIYRNCVKEKE